MRLGDRVVCNMGINQGKTGTIMEIRESQNPYNVKFDDGSEGDYCRTQVYKIDDITNSGNIEFRVGMKVYDVTFNAVGDIVEEKSIDEETKSYSLRWENGDTSEYPLNEEYNFIVIENNR